MNRVTFMTIIKGVSGVPTLARYHMEDIDVEILRDHILGACNGTISFLIDNVMCKEKIELAESLGYSILDKYSNGGRTITFVNMEHMPLFANAIHSSLCPKLEELYFMLCIGLEFDDALEIALDAYVKEALYQPLPD